MCLDVFVGTARLSHVARWVVGTVRLSHVWVMWTRTAVQYNAGCTPLLLPVGTTDVDVGKDALVWVRKDASRMGGERCS